MDNNFDGQQHEDELPSVSWFLALSKPNLLSGESPQQFNEKKPNGNSTNVNNNNKKRRPSSSSGAMNRPEENKKEKRCNSAKAKLHPVVNHFVNDFTPQNERDSSIAANNGFVESAEKGYTSSSLQFAQVASAGIRDIYGDHNYAMPIYQTPSHLQPSLFDVNSNNDGIVTTGSFFFSQEVQSPMGPSLQLNHHHHQPLMDAEDMEETNLSMFDDNKNYCCSCWSFGAAEECNSNSNFYNSNSEMMFFGNNNTAATMPLSY